MIEIHAERNLGCSATPEEDWSFSVSSRQLNVRGRSPGISGYMRLRNEVAFVDDAIASHLPFLDELVVVDNNSSDGTWECVQKWVQRAPDKIRAYRYLPTVQPLGTKGGLNLPTDHPSSFANYCNFALVQTRRQIAITIDGDHVAIASVFERAREFAVRNVNEKTYVSIFGINLVAHGRELYIANSYNYRAAPGVNEMRVGDVTLHSRRACVFFRHATILVCHESNARVREHAALANLRARNPVHAGELPPSQGC